MNTNARPSAVPVGALLRLKQVLQLVPVAKSTWWKGVKTGRFPQPVKLGSRVTAWKSEDIRVLLEKGI
ncbi:MAG TPA: AlpA family phage regulatory protein [Rubrivivax sp.]|nr:AlpA family phage regulatory protein [Rubrivivax sp.]